MLSPGPPSELWGQFPCEAAQQAGWHYLIAGQLLLSPHFSKLPGSESLHLRQTNETPALFCLSSSKRRSDGGCLLDGAAARSSGTKRWGQQMSLAGDKARTVPYLRQWLS